MFLARSCSKVNEGGRLWKWQNEVTSYQGDWRLFYFFMVVSTFWFSCNSSILLVASSKSLSSSSKLLLSACLYNNIIDLMVTPSCGHATGSSSSSAVRFRTTKWTEAGYGRAPRSCARSACLWPDPSFAYSRRPSCTAGWDPASPCSPRSESGSKCASWPRGPPWRYEYRTPAFLERSHRQRTVLLKKAYSMRASKLACI